MIKAEAKVGQNPETGEELVQTTLQLEGKTDDLIAEAGALLADIAAFAVHRDGMSKETHGEMSGLALEDMMTHAKHRLSGSAAFAWKMIAEAKREQED